MSGITLNIDSNPVEIMEELKEQQHYKNMWREQYKQQTKEIEKLKEENKKLKETNQIKDEVMEHIESYYEMDQHTKDYDKLDKMTDKLLNKIDELREDVETLKSMRVDDKISNGKHISQLKEQNEELKTSLQTTTSYWSDKYDILKEQAVKDNLIIEKFQMYCELIDEDPDAWEDLISNSPYYERNEDGELCRIDD